jgi:hypothetical protein
MSKSRASPASMPTRTLPRLAGSPIRFRWASGVSSSAIVSILNPGPGGPAERVALALRLRRGEAVGDGVSDLPGQLAEARGLGPRRRALRRLRARLRAPEVPRETPPLELVGEARIALRLLGLLAGAQRRRLERRVPFRFGELGVDALRLLRGLLREVLRVLDRLADPRYRRRGPSPADVHAVAHRFSPGPGTGERIERKSDRGIRDKARARRRPPCSRVTPETGRAPPPASGSRGRARSSQSASSAIR